MKRFYVAATLLSTVLLASLIVLGQTPQSPENKSLIPSKDELLKYEDFLRLKNTGLLRLLPREKYDTQELRRINRNPVAPEPFPRKTFDQIHTRTALTGAVDDVPGVNATLAEAKSPPVVGKKSRDVRGGGAYYSFTQKTHEYGYATDLSLEKGEFSTGFYGANYGFLTDLGDVPLESIDLNTPTVIPLATYKPANYDADARLEQRRFSLGADIDGVKVTRLLPMRLNSTYLLRAVNYDESDVLVAFKVVEIDSDGSPLILWKRLKRYSTPQYFRN